MNVKGWQITEHMRFKGQDLKVKFNSFFFYNIEASVRPLSLGPYCIYIINTDNLLHFITIVWITA